MTIENIMMGMGCSTGMLNHSSVDCLQGKHLLTDAVAFVIQWFGVAFCRSYRVVLDLKA
eukprot:CAMPEP_0197883248 /NCGR_PEP_ID=MMETSP1439-20131203/10142_1 /TAXON_ID=66791 /ORGANISM="Gonyaulax spinifera, Strain CCMP409" /LENGTH=58 /DNA_ID=CAMNT_0043502963 /DNA_START=105 /DNA_END=278 /DNA_ORIENTATION=+